MSNTILINYIRTYDKDFYSVLSFNLDAFIKFINEINMYKLDTDDIDRFILFKQNLFNKKVELALNVHDKIIEDIEFEKTQEKIIVAMLLPHFS